MLYETGGAFISVDQELKIVSDYIALEKLRYDESLHINFNYDVEDLKQSLPPLLLIPLVENAFKHALKSFNGNESFYLIEFRTQGGSDIEILLPFAFPREGFEDYCYHFIFCAI